MRSVSEPWADTTSPAGRMVLIVFAGIAEFERALIHQRTGAAPRRGTGARRALRQASLDRACSGALPPSSKNALQVGKAGVFFVLNQAAR
jgi:hypothetical protein